MRMVAALEVLIFFGWRKAVDFIEFGDDIALTVYHIGRVIHLIVAQDGYGATHDIHVIVFLPVR